MLPIITAFAKGETIEFNNGRDWVVVENVGFDFPPEQYRIAPPRSELWAVYEEDGRPVGHVKSLDDADQLRRRNKGRYIKKFVEEK